MRLVSLIFILACGSPSPTPIQAESKAELVAVYDVHEWGLLDTSLRTGALELSAGPGAAPPDFGGLGLYGVGKPILYVHVDGKLDEFELDVGVELSSAMTIAEHYPPGTLDEARRSLGWNALVGGTACRGDRSYPVADGPECLSVADHYCEAAELASYETDDAACIRVGEGAWPLLFYRGAPNEGVDLEPDQELLPVDVRRDSSGSVQVTNRTTMRPIGKLWHVRRFAASTYAFPLDWPPPGGTVTFPPMEGGGASEDEQAHEMIRVDLEAHGLTVSEIRAFDDAWHESVFGPRPTAATGRASPEGDEGELGLSGTGRGGGSVGGPRIGLGGLGTIGMGGGSGYGTVPHGTVYDALLYWLPAENFERVAELSLDPPPRAVRRAMLVRVDLAPQ